MPPVSTLLATFNKMLEEGPLLRGGEAEQDFHIICIGATGCGSSTFINRLIEDSAKPTPPLMTVGTGLSSQTREVKWTRLVSKSPAECTGKYSLYVGDTPGFNCSDRNITDPKIIETVRDSIPIRSHSDKPVRLGILLLQDSGIDRSPLPDDIAHINTELNKKVLKQLTIVTTKWVPSTPNSHHEALSNGRDLDRALLSPDPDADEDPHGSHSQEALLPRSTVGSVDRRERNQAQLATGLSRLLSASAELDASKVSGDEWRIVNDLVKRMDANNYVIRTSSVTPPVPQLQPAQRSWFTRYFGWIICE